MAETFVRGGAVRRAALAAGALDRAADPAQVSQIRLVLRLLESRAANVVLARRPVRFRDLSPAAREEYLLRWATSPIGRRRSAYQALRKLLTFLAYADPGDDGANPRWKSIGYRPDRPPVADIRTQVRPLTFAAGARGAGAGAPDATDAPLRLDADVVVIGSGAGGGVVAHDLAMAGRSVIVLEAGPFVDEATMPRGELEAFDRLYLGHGLTTTWDGSITMLAGAALGGGTLINWMTCIRTPADVRSEWATEHGIDGVADAAFEADLAAIESELSVAPASSVPPKDAVILRGAEALGLAAGRVARNSPGCDDCGSCGFGCPRGTKQSGIRSHLERAHAAGARVVADARVDRVVISAGRATGVEATWFGGGSSRRVVVEAAQVVVAAGALGTPGVLRRSGIAHREVGRNLRVHPAPVVAGLFREPIEMWRGTTQAARCDAFARGERGRNGYVVESAPAHPGLVALAMPWEGADAHASIMGRAAYLAPLLAVTRDGGTGRVTETPHGTARIDYELDDVGRSTLRHAMVTMARLVRAAGASEIVALGTPAATFGREGFASGGESRAFDAFEERLRAFDFAPNRGSIYSAHQMGTARMGADPRANPCDPRGR
ncbi:MAG TPA: GMC family oxidoreductase N-terminal domain-containing protein, partial [Candidatus Limnocylindrales bacterium]